MSDKKADLHIVDEPIANPRYLKFEAGRVDLKTGEVELEKDVSEAAQEFWDAVEKFYPVEVEDG